MPKIVSEEERILTKQAIYDKTVQLIKEKGLKSVTVDDICNAVGIGKGSFYSYYPSKEACLFEVIKQNEKELFSRLEKIMELGSAERDKVISLLTEVYTSKNSLVSSINQTDVESLLRKLPNEYRQMEKEKSENNFQKALELMNLNSEQMEVVALLADCLSFAASNQLYSPAGKINTLNVLINAIADFILQGGN